MATGGKNGNVPSMGSGNGGNSNKLVGRRPSRQHHRRVPSRGFFDTVPLFVDQYNTSGGVIKSKSYNHLLKLGEQRIPSMASLLLPPAPTVRGGNGSSGNSSSSSSSSGGGVDRRSRLVHRRAAKSMDMGENASRGVHGGNGNIEEINVRDEYQSGGSDNESFSGAGDSGMHALVLQNGKRSYHIDDSSSGDRGSDGGNGSVGEEKEARDSWGEGGMREEEVDDKNGFLTVHHRSRRRSSVESNWSDFSSPSVVRRTESHHSEEDLDAGMADHGIPDDQLVHAQRIDRKRRVFRARQQRRRRKQRAMDQLQQQQLQESLASARRKPQAEVYGFVQWIVSIFCIILYLLWAFLPENIMIWIDVTYYPDKYWALAIPSYLCVLIMALVLANLILFHLNVLPLDSKGACYLGDESDEDEEEEESRRHQLQQLQEHHPQLIERDVEGTLARKPTDLPISSMSTFISRSTDSDDDDWDDDDNLDDAVVPEIPPIQYVSIAEINEQLFYNNNNSTGQVDAGL